MRVLGINTGTSVDGVDLALIEWNDPNNFKSFTVIDELSFRFDPQVKHDIDILIGLHKGNLEDVSNLNFKFSQFLAALVDEFKKELEKEGIDKHIDLIGMHGQTIFHGSQSTFQLGNPSVVANLTGITTIGDFRAADMAVGGCGAPLTSFIDEQIISSPSEVRATLNIGGIANISVMEPGKDTIAYDTGPGNTLVDILMQRLFQKDFDQDGEIAYQGKVNEGFIENMIKRTDYFSKSPPKSTGRELFDEKYAEKFLDLGNKENIIATASYFTSATISKELKKFPIQTVYISGGGCKNKFIMQHLTELNPGISFKDHKEFGINGQYKEAMLFSLLAFSTQHGIANNVPSATGAKKHTVLGICASPYGKINNDLLCQTEKNIHSLR